MRVLLLDDVETNLFLLEQMLAIIDEFEIVKFLDPVEAIEWCRKNTLDIAIIDYMMPEMDGIEWAKRFREIKFDDEIPIIMITAHDDKEIKYLALNAGINDFLTKPIDKTELIARVKNMKRIREFEIRLSDRAKLLEHEVMKAIKHIERTEDEIILRLSRAAEFRDDDTYMHILRMSHYSHLIAKNLGLTEKECNMILKASPMHDVGKIGIPDHILLKPAKLTEEEFEIIKTHPEIGYKILGDSNIPLIKLSAEIALTHHEKYNGKGYPRGLKGEDIPISGRICAVADVFDALTSRRPYKDPWPVDKAIELLEREKGEHFDPQCVEAFLKDVNKILEIKENYKDKR